MEKKKLLLVAVSVGVFLVIVVSAAILIFSPPVDNFKTTAVVNESETPLLPSPAEPIGDASMGLLEEPLVVEADIEKTIADLAEAIEPKEAQSNVITIAPRSAAGVPATTTKPAAKPAPAPVARAAAPEKPKPPAAPKTAQRDYWVQVGSFSTKERADGVKHNLDSRGISTIITNQEVRGDTYYRVRMGPYTSQNEADYWLAMIKSIDGFQGSQIWESQSYR